LSTLKYWVWLSALTGLKPARRFALLEALGDPKNVYYADEKRLREELSPTEGELRLLLNKSLVRTEEILAQCRTEGISILTLQDAAYPRRLRNIFDPPVVLYVRGRLPAVDEEAAIGIVGTRKVTPYGLKMAKKLGFEVCRCGGVVVTGLAEGADSAAAEGALLAGGVCIGVLGCAIDDIYPRWNRALYEDVSLAGALVSEYPPGEALARWFFPERNRIISGLSLGVAVVEAPEKSGALITAELALEQGREVFAVPGNADAPGCLGSNRLIREGAQLVTDGWQMLADFAPQFPKLSEYDERKALPLALREDAGKSYYAGKASEKTKSEPAAESAETGRGFTKLRVHTDRKRIDNAEKREYIDLRDQLSTLTERQLRIVSALEDKSVHVDDIVEKTELSVPEVLSELTMLQIKGYVSQESGKRFSLNIKRR
jgi:DNA processing protein